MRSSDVNFEINNYHINHYCVWGAIGLVNTINMSCIRILIKSLSSAPTMADASDGWWAPILARLPSSSRSRRISGDRAARRHQGDRRRRPPPPSSDADSSSSPGSQRMGAGLGNRGGDYSPDEADVEWVRRVTCDGRALAIRREQDRRRPKPTLGTRPLLAPKPARLRLNKPRALPSPGPPEPVLPQANRPPAANSAAALRAARQRPPRESLSAPGLPGRPTLLKMG